MSIYSRNSRSNQLASPTRRDVLRATVALASLSVVASMGAPFSAFAADEDVQTFTRLSEFLTGHKLDPVLGGRFLKALLKLEAGFQKDVATLQDVVGKSGAADMDALLLTKPDAATMKTAGKIVSAWYLGVVGEAEKAELITYGEALMYRPTKGILPIPTYGPGPNAWGPKPDSRI